MKRRSASDEKMAANLRAAFELFDTGVAMYRQKLRREHPRASSETIEAEVRRWLRDRPDAPFGDAPGRPGKWPRTPRAGSTRRSARSRKTSKS